MQLLLIRHGEAEPLRRDDASRELTVRGREQARQSAAWGLNHGVVPDGLFASPYRRAQQTAAELSEVLDLPVTTEERLTPDREPDDVLAWLDSLDLPEDAVLALVCHMPLVARLHRLLCDGLKDGGGRAFHLAEVAVIEAPLMAAGLGKQQGGFAPH